jgi:hypothetical protein
LGAQLLSRPSSTSAEDVTAQLLAVQAQDPRGFRLAVRARSTGLTVADVEAELTDRRSLVVSWLNRGTLQLVTAQDYWWLHALTTPQLATANRRRLGQEGVSPAEATRGIEVVAAAVTDGAGRSRAELKQRLDDAGVPTKGQALVHVLLAAALEGLVVRGPVVLGQQLFVDPHTWLGGAPPKLDPEEALGRLADRYLQGHGPATAADLAKWAGVRLGDARRGLEAVRDRTTSTPDGLVDLVDRARPPRVARLRLLGPFDPLLLGWAVRDDVVGGHRSVVTTNGLIRPVVLADGRVVATWGLPSGAVTVNILSQVPVGSDRALLAEAADVLRFLGLPPRPLAYSSG